MKRVFAVTAALALLGLCVVAQAVVMETVTVGDAGNAADTRYGGSYGAVGYTYNIGKYEVTTAQYCDFLNHKAKSDPHGLYSAPAMGLPDGWHSCNIRRSGTSGNYSYSVGSGSSEDMVAWGDRPVNFVSYWDALRFANWLGNGQGNGDTENGTYTLTASGIANNTITRNTGWRVALASEDEWYKAAYYDPNKGGTGIGGFWDYSTRSDSQPSNVGSDGYTDPGNHANYLNPGYTLDGPYCRTNVGEFENSASAYGTYDQTGNVREWNEASVSQSYRCLRGGDWGGYYSILSASSRSYDFPTDENSLFGFRIVMVPEPSSIIALAGGLVGLLGIRRRRA